MATVFHSSPGTNAASLSIVIQMRNNTYTSQVSSEDPQISHTNLRDGKRFQPLLFFFIRQQDIN